MPIQKRLSEEEVRVLRNKQKQQWGSATEKSNEGAQKGSQVLPRIKETAGKVFPLVSIKEFMSKIIESISEVFQDEETPLLLHRINISPVRLTYEDYEKIRPTLDALGFPTIESAHYFGEGAARFVIFNPCILDNVARAKEFMRILFEGKGVSNEEIKNMWGDSKYMRVFVEGGIGKKNGERVLSKKQNRSVIDQYINSRDILDIMDKERHKTLSLEEVLSLPYEEIIVPMSYDGIRCKPQRTK
jgi:hypothetical protein